MDVVLDEARPWSRAMLTDLARALLVEYGADAEQASIVAQALTWCDAAGRHNQGVWRLPLLCERLERGLFNTPCRMSVERRAEAAYAIDGDRGMGHYVATRAMEVALEGARSSGVAVASVRNSNFFGAAAYYVQRAAAAGCVGLAMSNSFPKVAAHGGATAVLGTNPLAVGAPRAGGESFLLDMATSAAAGSTISKAIERGETLPDGVAIGADGRPITDPRQAAAGALLPAAGAKGYGLALAVEILAGVLAGAGVSHEVNSMYADMTASGNNGHLFIAIDIERFVPVEAFSDRLEALAAIIAGSGTGDSLPSLPGEARWRRLRESDARGIVLDPSTRHALAELAAAREVPIPSP